MGRNNRRNILETRIREVQLLEQELNRLRQAEANLGSIVLDKPIRDGWIRTFALREDIQKNKNAKYIQEALNAVRVEIWGRERKNADKIWNSYFKKYPRNYLRPGIIYLNQKNYNQVSTKAQKYFYGTLIQRLDWHQPTYICSLPKYYFKTSYRRAYIYSRNITSPELERRCQEIMELLVRQELYSHSIYNNHHYRLCYSPHKRLRRDTKMLIRKIDIDNAVELNCSNLKCF